MRTRFPAVCLSVVLPFTASTAAAQANASIALRAGTPGIGADLGMLLFGHAALRVSGAFYQLTTSRTVNDISYDVTLKLHSFAGLLDIYPRSRGSFRLTVGCVTDPAELDGTGRPSGSTFTINGTTYPSSTVGSLTGVVKFPSAAPYVGLGFGTPAHRHGAGVYFLFDLGAVVAKPTVSLAATGAAANGQLASNLQAQVDTTQQDIDKYVKVYPVLSIGIGLRF
ncbi:MAG TPA: hypothetical protein VLV45_04065 [Gemmatimonadales bacterium]|nr:hypothetical protein [Gemmatimonadales bacterium]